jgi:hypothetical protein
VGRVRAGGDAEIEGVDEVVVGGVIDADLTGFTERRWGGEGEDEMRVGIYADGLICRKAYDGGGLRISMPSGQWHQSEEDAGHVNQGARFHSKCLQIIKLFWLRRNY